MASDACYDVVVVTTAALPWRTGPAYFSLWHAAGLAELGLRVAYVVPWLGARSQQRLWGAAHFRSFDQYTAWLHEEARRIGAPPLPTVQSYRGYYSVLLRSIVPLHSIFRDLPSTRVIVLQEPEHLCWHPATAPRGWIAAERVVGIVMTDYRYYVAHAGWPRLAPWIDRFHRHLMRRHTDLILSISPSVTPDGLAHPVQEAQVTGVLPAYRQIPPVTAQRQGVFFLGRLVWDKGLDLVIELAQRTGIRIDLIGEGPDAAAIAAQADAVQAPIRLLGHADSPWERLGSYRVFFNPSRSEGLCTATADALVAGRHVVLPDCPANRPFLRYPNVHPFEDLAGAQQALERALSEPPAPSTLVRQDFDWMHACRNLAGLCGLEP
jgi:digalactosyldiacylglycerol synthase